MRLYQHPPQNFLKLLDIPGYGIKDSPGQGARTHITLGKWQPFIDMRSLSWGQLNCSRCGELVDEQVIQELLGWYSQQCIHLDPAKLQQHHPIPGPKSHSSQESIRGTKNHFVCSRLLTIIKNKSNFRCSKGVYTLTQPTAASLTINRKWEF